MKGIIFPWRLILPLLPLFVGSLYFLQLFSPLPSENISPSSKIQRIPISGVIDQLLPEGYAVILLEDLGLQLIVPNEVLPDGSKESMYVKIILQEENYSIESLDLEKTEEALKRSEELRLKLSEKNRIQ